MFASLSTPVIAAPMAGGPTTPQLVVAARRAGGFGFLAAGYKSVNALADDIATVRADADLFGVNVFAPQPPFDAGAAEAYRAALSPVADRFGVAVLPQPAADDDSWAAKLDLLISEPVPFVSFTFGLPGADVVRRLQAVGTRVLATVTSMPEAKAAARLGYDALVVQGPEAGGHRGTHDQFATPDPTSLSDLLTSVSGVVDLPLIAAGGLATGETVRAALTRASAVQVGTALLLNDEAGTSPIHRKSLQDRAFDETVVTRCFTGRAARALRNRFYDEFDDVAPAAYPAVHQITGPLRKAAAAQGDAQWVHLWAGTGWRDARTGPAVDVIRSLG